MEVEMPNLSSTNDEIATTPKQYNAIDQHNNSETEAEPNEVGTVKWLSSLRIFSKYGIGVILIVLVAIIWVGASLWIQRIFGDLEFNKPYFLTYFNTAGFSLWNFGYFSKPWRSVPMDHEESNSGHSNPEDNHSVSGSDCEGGATPNPTANERTELAPVAPTAEEQPYSRREILRCAIIFCPLWFAANALFNASLSTTSVASNTILSSTSSIWALVFSKVFLNQEVVRWYKLGAIAMVIGGSSLVAFSDSNSNSDHSLLGDALALISAFFYGAYTTCIKWMLPEESRYYMGMLFGFVGVVNILFMWPGLILLDATGIEPFQLPSFEVLWSLAVNALIGTNLSDVMWAKSVVLTSPFVATLGLSLSTPIAMIADALISGSTYNAMYICGAISVTIGFVLCNLGV